MSQPEDEKRNGGQGVGPGSPGGDERPVLRRTERRRAPAAEGADAPFAATRLTVLAHELANILDGSMRTLGLAQRAMDGAAAGSALDAGVMKRIQTVHAALEQMAELVRGAMSGVQAEAVLGRRPGMLRGWSLAAAAEHAAEVMRPVAEDAGVRLDVAVAPEAAGVEAGPIYPVLAAGVRNAVEAVERRGESGGSVDVRVRVERASEHPGGMVLIEIADTGAGPPALGAGQERRVFELGFSTKRAGAGAAGGASGIGLAMALETVRGLGGWIELLPREGGKGAVLRIRYPVRAGKRREEGGAAA